MRIKKGDKIQVISGKDRGKSGNVLKVIPGSGKILVEKINIIKKHIRPKKEGESGQRVESPVPIDISNAMLLCSKCGKPTRVSYKVSSENKFRICNKCEAEI